MTPDQADAEIKRGRPATPSAPEFVRVGSVKPGTPCAQCGKPGAADNPVHIVASTRIDGCLPASLHLTCAPMWFAAAPTDSNPDAVIDPTPGSEYAFEPDGSVTQIR